MAKLRKMLGSIDDPRIEAIMRMIETQSKPTLSAWAAAYAQAHYLPIYEKAYPDDRRLRELVSSVTEYLGGSIPLSQVKAHLRDARKMAQQAAETPAAQAAARAVVTACATVQTPTNALGFAFYGAAAVAYDQAGTNADAPCYDALAAHEFEQIGQSLQAASVPGEANPVQIQWNC